MSNTTIFFKDENSEENFSYILEKIQKENWFIQNKNIDNSEILSILIMIDTHLVADNVKMYFIQFRLLTIYD